MPLSGEALSSLKSAAYQEADQFRLPKHWTGGHEREEVIGKGTSKADATAAFNALKWAEEQK